MSNLVRQTEHSKKQVAPNLSLSSLALSKESLERKGWWWEEGGGDVQRNNGFRLHTDWANLSAVRPEVRIEGCEERRKSISLTPLASNMLANNAQRSTRRIGLRQKQICPTCWLKGLTHPTNMLANYAQRSTRRVGLRQKQICPTCWLKGLTHPTNMLANYAQRSTRRVGLRQKQICPTCWLKGLTYPTDMLANYSHKSINIILISHTSFRQVGPLPRQNRL